MDLLHFAVRTWWTRLYRLGKSEGFEAFRFYASYFRWPVLFVLLGLGGEKLFYYGLIPLGGVLTRELAYAEAANDDARGDEKEAAQAIRRALLETRDNARLWRLAARISDRSGSPEALYCWRQADRLNPGSTDTEISLAEAALRDHQVAAAEAALAEVAVADQGAVRFQVAAGKTALLTGQPERARACFERVEAAAPTDAGTLFNLADWRAGRAGADDWDRAQHLLAGLAARPAERPRALRALIDLDLQRGRRAEARSCSDTLLAGPDATFSDRVRRLDLAEPEPVGQLEKQLADLLQGAERTDAASVLEWMAAHGRAEPALIWIRHQSGDAQDDPALGTARARCLAALGEWEHLHDDQRDSIWPGQEPDRLLIQAQASVALKHEDDAREEWNEAIAACREADDFMRLLRFAERLPGSVDWTDEKAEVWMALARQYPGEQWPLRALLAYQLGRDDLLQVEAIEARLAELDPGDPALAANRDLVALLRGAGTEKASADLQRLEAAAPGNPAVATAAAYALYLQGRFSEALGAMGALSPEELAAPERAAYLGELLAAAGPVDRAEASLRVALSRPQLLAEERPGVMRKLDLVAYRRAMDDLLGTNDSGSRERARTFFTSKGETGAPVFVLGQCVALALNHDRGDAMRVLAEVDPAMLDPAELLIYQGALRQLTGEKDATGYLQLSADLPDQARPGKLHQALEDWWKLEGRGSADPSITRGLLATYRGLETAEPEAAFWRNDAPRELELTRGALQEGESAAAVQDRLTALLHHVPSTPRIEAQIAFALFLQGRVATARARLEMLSAADLARPEAALYYATVQRAAGGTKDASSPSPGAPAGPLRDPQIAQDRTKP